jgi:hypothetical protein
VFCAQGLRRSSEGPSTTRAGTAGWRENRLDSLSPLSMLRDSVVEPCGVHGVLGPELQKGRDALLVQLCFLHLLAAPDDGSRFLHRSTEITTD